MTLHPLVIELVTHLVVDPGYLAKPPPPPERGQALRLLLLCVVLWLAASGSFTLP